MGVRGLKTTIALIPGVGAPGTSVRGTAAWRTATSSMWTIAAAALASRWPCLPRVFLSPTRDRAAFWRARGDREGCVESIWTETLVARVRPQRGHRDRSQRTANPEAQVPGAGTASPPQKTARIDSPELTRQNRLARIDSPGSTRETPSLTRSPNRGPPTATSDRGCVPAKTPARSSPARRDIPTSCGDRPGRRTRRRRGCPARDR